MSEDNPIIFTARARFDAPDIGLEVEPPAGLDFIPAGSTVRWRFKPEEIADYWAAVLYFDVVTKNARNYYGPFPQLIQTVKDDHLVVEGTTEANAQGVYGYHVVLYKGVAEHGMPGDHRETMLVCSSRQMLKVDQPQQEPRNPPDTTANYTLSVQPTEDETQLLVAPPLTPILHDDTAVKWDFGSQGTDGPHQRFWARVQGDFPLIVFYKCRQSPNPDTNVSFGPFDRICYLPGMVIGRERNDSRGCFHYEAVVISSQNHAVKFVSSGDPQLDSEGGG